MLNGLLYVLYEVFWKNRYFEEKRRDMKIILKLVSLQKYFVYNVIN
jgi:hypothetical protein